MALGDLGGAVGADLGQIGRIGVLGRIGVVAAAKGAMTDELIVAPALGGGDVPDVLVRTTQTKRRLGANLFWH